MDVPKHEQDVDSIKSSVVNDNESEAKPTTKARVWVGRVPPSLCVSQEAVRDVFEPFGAIQSIRIHHDFVDMTANGFMFIEFQDHDAAEKAIQAVSSGSIGDFQMTASMAVERGPLVYEPDQDVIDLLSGRRQARLANAFSQHLSMDTEQDEEERMLQSLSQHSFLHASQSRKKKKKRVRISADA